MIADISNTFGNNTVLSQKIAYHIEKIEKGVGEYLYDNFYENNIHLLYNEMVEVGEMNERVNKKYLEFSLNFVPGEVLDNEKLVDIAKEYLQRMGYENACFGIIKHTDKEHLHLHILSTTIDYEGNHIADNNSRLRSQKISRELELKYGLKTTEYSKFKSESLKAIKHREYFFANALNKGLSNYACKVELASVLSDKLQDIKGKTFNNDFYEVFLGKEKYETIGRILEKNNMFSRLYKEELLHKLDEIYSISNSREEFILKLHQEGYYARLLRDKKGEYCYTYGVGDVGKYFKETSLPQKYRFNSLSDFKTETKSTDQQKEFISGAAFVAVKESKNLDEFIDKIHELGVEVFKHSNSSGVYGISFSMLGIKNAVSFKASELTADRAFSYISLQKYFNGENSKLLSYEAGHNKLELKYLSFANQKESILSIVESAIQNTNSSDSFRKYLKDNGISFWKNRDASGKFTGYSFKLVGNVQARPIKASDLGEVFTHDIEQHLSYLKKVDAENSIKRFRGFTGRMVKHEQIDYIYLIALKNIADNPSFEQFRKRMNDNGIIVRENSQVDKVSNYSFKIMRDEGEFVTGKQISDDFNSHLFRQFSPGSLPVTALDTPSNNNDNSFVTGPSDSHTMDDNEPLSAKKKKKKRNNNIYLE